MTTSCFFRRLLLAGLCLAGCTPAPSTRTAATGPARDSRLPERVERIAEARRGPLTAQEREMARIAWRYFENNYQPATGFVNAVQDYPSTTMWDTGSSLAALVAAERFGLVDRAEFDRRLTRLLATLETLSFFRDELPNKVYHTQTAEKVNYGNQPGEIGFSALDLGRLLIWLDIVRQRYPEYAPPVDRFVLRWNVCNLVDPQGTLFGAALEDGTVQYLQEGRLGYEEYAAKGFQLWGFTTRLASMAEPFEVARIYGIDVPHDQRDPRTAGAHNYVVTESYALDGIEFGWDDAHDRTSAERTYTDIVSANFAQRIYRVQELRWQRTGITTARTEHQLDRDPYFVYDTIFTDGYAWNTITESGRNVPEYAAVAVKGALGLWALWNTPYTDHLFATIAPLHDPEKGYLEGVYENGSGPINTVTANNNGIRLETLLFKVEGKLYRDADVTGPWEQMLRTPGADDRRCLRARQAPPS